MDPTAEFAQLQLGFVDQTQRRYEVIRPLVLFADRTAVQRAHETQTHPDTVRKLQRRFQHQGMLGLLPSSVEVIIRERTKRIPDAVRQEIDRLKALYDGFHYRELARILLVKVGYPIDDKTVKKLWQQSAVRRQEQLDLWDYHTHPDRYQARLQVVKLYYQGWEKVSISRFLHVSRPTVDAWIQRFEAEQFAGLVEKRRGPTAPRKVWLPLMVQVYHLQKGHPDAGEFRIWSLLARPDIAVRTVGRIMALNRLVYDDIPHVPKRGVKRIPGPHPYKASHRHQYWFIDGRQLDFRVDGVKWWSLMILEGYSRTILAGAIAPTEATWVALMVLYTACIRYGAPDTLVSDSGGAYTSNDFEAVCTRLQLQHETIESTKGESYQNLMETHFNIQRRLYDYQFSLAPTPAALEQVHQAFIRTYNTTAHQGLLKDRRLPPIPVEVLGTAKGRVYAPDELARRFSQALVPRTTNRYGCVTLHSYHFYVEEGLPRTQVLLWVAGEQLRAAFDNVILAEYHCRYDWRDRKVKDIRDGVFYHTRFAASQRALIPLTPQESLVVYRARSGRQRGPRLAPAQQLLLFELA
ncbi:MAG: helix-turn-helix domain-containing protein [Candidatus Tectomicrobia bacterium]|nr:helix-turn-helix domain-containing protein [Candidatus Tectomicrobia bacterium]